MWIKPAVNDSSWENPIYLEKRIFSNFPKIVGGFEFFVRTWKPCSHSFFLPIASSMEGSILELQWIAYFKFFGIAVAFLKITKHCFFRYFTLSAFQWVRTEISSPSRVIRRIGKVFRLMCPNVSVQKYFKFSE